MASKAKQQTYRRLMKEVKGKSSAQQKKIDHPLARYNALDQLSCIVCQQVVKTELLWETHLKSKKHKEIIAELKNNKQILQPKKPVGKTKSGVIEQSSSRQQTAEEETETIADNETEDDISSDRLREEPPAKKQKVTSEVEKDTDTSLRQPKSSLPKDFFDAGISKEDGDSGDERGGVAAVRGSSEGEVQEAKTATAAVTESSEEGSRQAGGNSLPEGFFDDPKLDAKVRKVEYKDKLEEEWERFQKTIQKENDVSEAIVFVADEEAQGDRDIFEVQEQVECFQKAETLRLKQEELLEKLSKRKSTSEQQEPLSSVEKVRDRVQSGEVMGEDSVGSGSSDEDNAFDELEMDWRAKNS